MRAECAMFADAVAARGLAGGGMQREFGLRVVDETAGGAVLAAARRAASSINRIGTTLRDMALPTVFADDATDPRTLRTDAVIARSPENSTALLRWSRLPAAP